MSNKGNNKIIKLRTILQRDVNAQVFEYDHISPDSILPSNWVTFLSVRKHKRLFVNFISDQFLANDLANLKFPKLECFFCYCRWA